MAALRPYEMRVTTDAVVVETEVWSPVQEKWVEFATFYMRHDADEVVRRWNALIGVRDPDAVPRLRTLLHRLEGRRVGTTDELRRVASDVMEILTAFAAIGSTEPPEVDPLHDDRRGTPATVEAAIRHGIESSYDVVMMTPGEAAGLAAGAWPHVRDRLRQEFGAAYLRMSMANHRTGSSGGPTPEQVLEELADHIGLGPDRSGKNGV